MNLQVITHTPSHEAAYNNAGVVYESIGNNYLAELFGYTGAVLRGEANLPTMLNPAEKEKIRTFVARKDFDGLGFYMRELARRK